MAIEVKQAPAKRAEVAVRVVDSDVHPVPKPGVWIEYVPEPWRSKFWAKKRVGETINYDAPDYAHAMAMRTDTFPPDGGFPGSDPDLAFRQLIVEAGSDIGILEPGSRHQIIPEVDQAGKMATNRWLAANWLDAKNNWHGRWRGSICVNIEDPQGAAREIEYWAGHEYMVQVLINAEPRPAWGDPKYDPVWEAATRHDLPVSCHLGRGYFELYPMPPVGFPSYNHDFMVTYSLLAANQVMSLVFDGVFERFPTMKVILVEHAFSWILPLLWRMDKIYQARKGDLPHLKRKPSEYVYDHIRFTTQPLDYPDDMSELTRALEWMDAGRLLLFSSDYPHWTFDDPKWVVTHLPKQMRDRIMFENGIELYHLPRTVPAIDRPPVH
ncbi:MAG TPA: amidohydrolase family protein [Candidatus Dormibacteraeota bacterium]|nr:amidohydrolase family protein [Candidatus Dormibacteraeota bacterium]